MNLFKRVKTEIMDTITLAEIKFERSYNLLLSQLINLATWLESHSFAVAMEHKFLMSISRGTLIIQVRVNALDGEFYVFLTDDEAPFLIAKSLSDLKKYLVQYLTDNTAIKSEFDRCLD